MEWVTSVRVTPGWVIWYWVMFMFLLWRINCHGVHFQLSFALCASWKLWEGKTWAFGQGQVAGLIENNANSVCSADLKLEVDWAWQKISYMGVTIVFIPSPPCKFLMTTHTLLCAVCKKPCNGCLNVFVYVIQKLLYSVPTPQKYLNSLCVCMYVCMYVHITKPGTTRS